MMTRKFATYGCSFLWVVFFIALIISIQHSITWLYFVSGIFLFIYSLGLIIILYDYYITQ